MIHINIKNIFECWFSVLRLIIYMYDNQIILVGYKNLKFQCQTIRLLTG
jgi:hypothetical protein